MKKFAQFIFFAFALVCGAAHAGTQALGFEIGVSTVDQVRTVLSKQTRVNDSGVNKFSAGPMLKTDGSSYEIEGLIDVVYIFDEQKKLAGVLLTMDKDRFDAIFKALSGKYKVSSQQRPFVGNQFARFKTADAVIEINAPHLSFQMDVNYLRNDLFQKFNSQTAADTEAKRKREAEKL